ncbi:MAG: hypothetical protein WBL39_22850, partial [Terrimicrobiaceae bacterium]
PALLPWQDADALELPQAIPEWFQQEIALFDNTISNAFLKKIEVQLGLAEQENRKMFAAERPISKKLRELVVFELDDVQQASVEAELFDEPLEKLIPSFTAQARDLKTILGRCLGPSTRLRSKPLHELKIIEFVQLFVQEGLHRLPLLIGRLRELQSKINRSPRTTPGFGELWHLKSTETDERLNEAEGLLKDFDLVLGRYLENSYKQAVPSQILSTNRLLEKRIGPAIAISTDRPVAILVFDGMRYDLWREIVRPHLERRFAVEEEMAA